MRIAALAMAIGVSIGGSIPPLATPGEFVWHDLVTDDPAAARKFYGSLFGWRFEDGAGVDPGYTIIFNHGQPIGGIARRRLAEMGPAMWLAYVMVPDVDRATAAFVQTGGRIIRGPLNARKDLRVAAVADAQGAIVGVSNRGPRAAPPATTPLHDWLWMEYVARDADSALTFYADVFGYHHEVADPLDGFTYHILSTDRPRAGLFKTLSDRDESRWLPYIRVEDPAAMAARVEQLGGTVLVPPQRRVRNNSLTIVLDSMGAPLALQKFPFDHAGATP